MQNSCGLVIIRRPILLSAVDERRQRPSDTSTILANYNTATRLISVTQFSPEDIWSMLWEGAITCELICLLENTIYLCSDTFPKMSWHLIWSNKHIRRTYTALSIAQHTLIYYLFWRIMKEYWARAKLIFIVIFKNSLEWWICRRQTIRMKKYSSNEMNEIELFLFNKYKHGMNFFFLFICLVEQSSRKYD